jgi:serpin B
MRKDNADLSPWTVCGLRTAKLARIGNRSGRGYVSVAISISKEAHMKSPFAVTGAFLAALTTGPVLAEESREQEASAAVQGNTAFALELYAKIAGGNDNICFSPHSLSTALAMTMAGARSETEASFARVLHLDPKTAASECAALARKLREQQAGGPELRIANALWGQQGSRFREASVELVRRQFAANFATLDFAKSREAATEINGWAAKETADRILDLISETDLNADTRLVLANAIFFKGAWATQFTKTATRAGEFSLSNGEKKLTPFMNLDLKNALYRDFEKDEVQVLKLPYAKGSLQFCVLLPKGPQGRPSDPGESWLAALEKKLTPEALERWTNFGPCKCQHVVSVSLPKLKLTWENRELATVLQGLGLELSGDFSGMLPEKNLAISKVLQKTFLEVNEEGTEAAAATAVVSTGGGESNHWRFLADHPFLFVIRDDKTGSVLFMGRVTEPRT